jgi:hypothetical protein
VPLVDVLLLLHLFSSSKVADYMASTRSVTSQKLTRRSRMRRNYNLGIVGAVVIVVFRWIVGWQYDHDYKGVSGASRVLVQRPSG